MDRQYEITFTRRSCRATLRAAQRCQKCENWQEPENTLCSCAVYAFRMLLSLEPGNHTAFTNPGYFDLDDILNNTFVTALEVLIFHQFLRKCKTQ